MVRRQRFPNQWDSPIDENPSGIGTGDTSFDVNDASALPTEGEYQVACDSEIMTVTGRSSNTLTVKRAQHGTSTTPHTDDRDVHTLLTKQAIEQAISECGQDFSELPRGYPTVLRDRSGNALTSSDFSVDGETVGGSGTSIADENGVLVVRSEPNGGVNAYTGYVMNSAPTHPYTITAHFMMPVSGIGSTQDKVGIGVRGTSGGRMTIFNYTPEYNIWVRHQNTFLSWNSSFDLHDYYRRNDCWLRWTASSDSDNPTWTFQTSWDNGNTWVQIRSETENSFVNSGYNIGFWFNLNNVSAGPGAQVHVDCWVVEDSVIAADYTI